ncbi:hypothetical protein [Pseudomonas sp.]|uniref:hypothetical protein n=1 Tax=Pseudomonas sp. TaxID=306 RepID=UPI003CC67A37
MIQWNVGGWLKPVTLVLLMPVLLVALHYLPVPPGARAWLATLGGLGCCAAALVHDSCWFKASMFGALLLNVLLLALINDRDVVLPFLALLYRFVWL